MCEFFTPLDVSLANKQYNSYALFVEHMKDNAVVDLLRSFIYQKWQDT